MRRLSLLLTMLVMLCGTIRADGYDFYVGRVYYRIILGNDMKPTTNVEVVKGDEKYSGDIVIPSSITVNKNEYTVTRIGQDAFYDCKSVTSISLPNSITSKLEVIEGRAFGNCEGLTSIKIPDSVTEIGQFAFLQCTNLKTVYMGRGLKTVRYNAFGYCEALERVEISDLAAWCGIAFYYNGSASGWFGPHANPLSYAGHLYLNGEEVVDLVIPKEVTSIHGDLNFCGCVGLKSVTFPDDCNVEYIGAFTFQGCENIKSLKLNKHLKRIYECAFSGCKSIESLVIPDEVTLISCAAFSGCSSLKELKLGNALEVIETGFWGPAFGGTSVTEIVVPEKIKNLNGFWNSKLSIVNIGKTSLTEISGTGRDAILPIERINITDLATFMGIKKQLGGYDLYLNGNLVEDLTIPSSVSEIGERAMQGCQRLKNITIPSHVKTINDKAFNGCYYIETITFEGGSPTIGKDVFGTYNNTYIISKMREPSGAPNGIINECQRRNILCVPAGCKETYGTAEGWNTFRYIVEASGPEEAFLDRGNLYRIYGDEVTLVKGGAHAYWGYYLPETATYQDKTYPITVIGGEVHDGFSPDIVIYAGVKQIVEKVFANCTGVHTVTSYIKNPYAINSNVFSAETKQSAILIVPYGTKAKYQSTDGWKEFANIEEMDPEPSEPYVVYNDGTLTFYCDNQRSSREGTTYGLNDVVGDNCPSWNVHYDTTTKVVFDASFSEAKPKTTYRWFSNFWKITEIQGMEYLNTSEVTNMGHMFYMVSSLANLDVSGFDTRNATNMNSMFFSCSTLTNLDVSGFETGKVTDMIDMFNNCRALTSLNVSEFDTRNVKNMSSMLINCKALKELILGSNFITTDQVACANVFSKCAVLNKITFTGDIPASINSEFFSLVGSAETPVTLTVPEQYKSNYAAKFDGNKFYGGYFKMSGEEINYYTITLDSPMRGFCADCDLDFSAVKDLNAYIAIDYSTYTRNVNLKAISDAPAGTGLLLVGSPGAYRVPIVKSKSDKKKNMLKGVLGETVRVYPKEGDYTNYLFYSEGQQFISIGYWGPYVDISPGYIYLQVPTQAAGDTQKISPAFGEPTVGEEPYVVYNDYTLTFYCDNQRSSRQGTTYDLNEGSNPPEWQENKESITKAVFDASFTNARPTTTSYWFWDLSSLTKIEGMNYLNTSEVTDMYSMFDGCRSLTALDLSHFDTKNVTNMGQMFYGCNNLKSLNLSNFDTGNVTYMGFMFYLCYNLTSLDVSHFDTSKVTGMRMMFASCQNLTTLDISCFDVQSATDLSEMFAYCHGLTTLDVSKFNTENAETMGYMFKYCDNLTSLDLSSFSTRNAKDRNHETWTNYGIEGMLSGCNNLAKIAFGSGFASDDKLSCNSVFSGCDALSNVTYTGDIPTSINSTFFIGVGTANAPATLVVPEQYKANYQAKFSGNQFYSGYFTMSNGEASGLKDGDTFTVKTVEGVEMTFKVISAADKTCQLGDGTKACIDTSTSGSFTIPAEVNGFRVNSVASWALYGCYGLNEIVISEGVESLMDNSIEQCNGVTSFVLPASVTSLSNTFGGVSSCLKSIKVAEGNPVYDSRNNCNAIIETASNVLRDGCVNTVIPSTVTAIGDWAMCNKNLTSISIPSSVKSIGDGALRYNPFKTVTIPESIENVGFCAFEECWYLEKVTIASKKCRLEGAAFANCGMLKTVVSYLENPEAVYRNIFYNSYDGATSEDILNDNVELYVPFGTKTIYENTNGWKNFKNIVEMNATVGDVTGDGEVTKEDITEVEAEIINPSEEYDPNKDVNHDGVVNVADIVEEVNIINSGEGTGSGQKR